jgi:hypothetical protein
MFAKVGKLALLLAVTQVGVSCILTEKCIVVHEQGVQWKVRVTGTATEAASGQVTISGTFYDCKNKQNDELLQLMNVNTPQYVAVANPMIAEASSNCIKKALDEGYMDVECDPFDGEQDVVVTLTRLGGDCPLSDLTVAKGDPEECLQGADPGETDGATHGTTTSTTTLDIPTTTMPTTTGGDSEATTVGDTVEPTVGDAETTTGGDDSTTGGDVEK